MVILDIFFNFGSRIFYFVLYALCVMVSVLALSAEVCGFGARPGQAKYIIIGICSSTLSTQHRSKSRDWSAQSQINVPG